MVAPRFRQVVLDTTDPRMSAEFWRQFLGLTYRAGHEPPPNGAPDQVGGDWLNLLTNDGQAFLAFQNVETMTPPTWPDATVPRQLHLDLSVRSKAELRDAVDHAKELGGTVLLDRYGDAAEPLFVLTDPAGHPFCVFVVED
ncbi:MAG: VOC family protein [Acidimicrobiales bacterium]